MTPDRDWPYRFWLLDSRDRTLVESKHKTFSSLYAEVRASQVRIAREKDPHTRKRDPAARWMVSGTTASEDAQLVAGDPGKP